MKKTSYYLLTALSIAALSSCVKEMTPEEITSGQSRTYTIELAPTTRTDITAEGKTVWKAGDKILLTDGTEKDTVVVSATDDGKAFATIESCMAGTEVFAIYPATAAAAEPVVDGKVNVVVPADQSGLFADANIAVAKVSDYKFQMKNATAVMKVSTPADGLFVVFNASGDALAGNIAVSFAEDGTITTEASGTNGIITCEAPTADVYYVAVAAGTYKAGFSIMAVDGATGDFQTKATTADKSLSINDLADLGVIGDDMSGFAGAGSEGDPYKITSIGEMIALANSTNIGNDYAGKYFKVMNDISGVSLPVGYYNAATKIDYYFKGNFDGDNHTITLDLDGAKCKTASYVALFGELGPGASIKNVTVEGIVNSPSGSCVGGIGGCVNAGADGISFTNCHNKATVNGKDQVGGIVGFADNGAADALSFTDCSNSGSITASAYYAGGIAGYLSAGYKKTLVNCVNSASISASNGVGGVVGYGQYVNLSNCNNSGEITATSTAATGCQFSFNNKAYATGTSGKDNLVAAGGVAGALQNEGAFNCTNSGNVSGPFKVGGVMGVSYWATANACRNDGDVVATVSVASSNPASQTHFVYGSVAGGIVGWTHTQGNFINCVNNGSVKGKGNIAGIVGYYYVGGQNKVGRITGCVNNGDIISEGAYVGGVAGINPATGGICGTLSVWSNGSTYTAPVDKCVNNGKISTNGICAGGIVGKLHTGYSGSVQSISNCQNTAEVSAQYYVGGMVGLAYGAYKQTVTIKNCSNTGLILGNRPTDGGECAGGILGASHLQNNNATYNHTINIYNCFNSGDVLYEIAAHVKPYSGGICGRWEYLNPAATNGAVLNCVNYGFVGPKDHSKPLEGALMRLGTLVGSLEVAGKTDYSYFQLGVSDETVAAFGTSSAAAGANVSSYDDIGELSSVITVNEVPCTTAIDALNQWVLGNGTSYLNWQEGARGPEFATAE